MKENVFYFLLQNKYGNFTERWSGSNCAEWKACKAIEASALWREEKSTSISEKIRSFNKHKAKLSPEKE